MTTTVAALNAWKTYGIPTDIGEMGSPERRRLRFAFLASLYDGSAYAGTTGVGQKYREDHGLYASTRQVTNPVKALCDFYAVHLYPGPTSPDGEAQVEGHDAALPLVPLVGQDGEGEANDAADTALRRAFGQLSHGWWAWDTNLVHRVRQTAVLGTTLTEIVDEPATGKLMTDLIYPGLIEEVTLDSVGNVKGYVLAYTVEEAGSLERSSGTRTRGRRYRFRKVVDGDWYRFYEDGALVREDRNPYGFVPAVLDRHMLGWAEWGEPAILGSQTAADELNELWSHADDRLHQMFASPLVVSGAAKFEEQKFDGGKRGTVGLFGVPAGGQVGAIEFSLGEVMTSVDRIMDAIALEAPELRVYDRIREMSQVTGPGIRRAVADAEHRLNTAASLYDRQTIKLLQMGTAIAGWRIATGAWGGALTSQQRVFAPFDLESFTAGQLDCLLLPRALVKPTMAEKIADQAALELLRERASLDALGLPEEEIAARLAGQADRERQAAEARERFDAEVTGIAAGEEE